MKPAHFVCLFFFFLEWATILDKAVNTLLLTAMYQMYLRIASFSCNHGQKSRDKFALLALLRTRQTRIQLHLPNLALHQPYNVENYYLQFLLNFNIAFLKKECSALIFSKFNNKTDTLR